ncbi:glycosyltransferase family 9 protein [Actinophytocola sp.]|uniref:glycosyltransferase family 9 protein n=1 Tax=Actinophytocola sp. TaxID=1872138 RepID=UPI003899E197
MNTGVAPTRERWPDVRRIAVVRGGGLGDLIFAVPALHALAAAYPDARIVLLGTAAHAALLDGRPGPVTEVVPLPPAKGLFEPAGVPVPDDVPEDFLRRVGPVDLGVQLHGGGRWSNRLLGRLGARWSVGCRTPDAPPLTRSMPYRLYQSEIIRALEVVALAGAAPVTLQPELPLTEADRESARRVLDGLPRPLVVIHPGATDPRRHWPADHFAEVAKRCTELGRGVVVVGSAAEREQVAAAPGVRELPDLDLGTLCGVLAAADVFVGNDSGPRHMAQAVGTATVGVYWIGNVITGGPLGRGRDRIAMSWTRECPVCGRDCTRVDLPRCPHDVSFVAEVTVDEVWAELSDLLNGELS